jgi:hypothetical protein
VLLLIRPWQTMSTRSQFLRLGSRRRIGKPSRHREVNRLPRCRPKKLSTAIYGQVKGSMIAICSPAVQHDVRYVTPTVALLEILSRCSTFVGDSCNGF